MQRDGWKIMGFAHTAPYICSKAFPWDYIGTAKRQIYDSQ